MTLIYSAVTVVVLSVLWYVVSGTTVGPEMNVSTEIELENRKFDADSKAVSTWSIPEQQKVDMIEKMRVIHSQKIIQIPIFVAAQNKTRNTKLLQYHVIAILCILATGIGVFHLPGPRSKTPAPQV